ncbi:MAG: YigZ family protein [Chloroflexaceae bacterium]|nr:YigZ family protein [Chloroflexaceae bacterium]NJL34492.1 YigZ family protein [Chloroflexaceae bacterium]NJO04261.1 YigZ family protein [Chloroflexaceae bacterium]
MSSLKRYHIPSAPARTELRFANSRFIGSANYTPTVELAKDFIAQVRAEMPGATHHVYAYLIGFGASLTAGMSDAGEPSGTAGRPILAVLRGSGLGDVTIVVTRFFGGTLLGTGGLVRAYSDTARAVLDILPRTERIEKCSLTINISYGNYPVARQVLEAHGAEITDEIFATHVTVTANLPVTAVDACTTELATVTAGQAHVHHQNGV